MRHRGVVMRSSVLVGLALFLSGCPDVHLVHVLLRPGSQQKCDHVLRDDHIKVKEGKGELVVWQIVNPCSDAMITIHAPADSPLENVGGDGFVLNKPFRVGLGKMVLGVSNVKKEAQPKKYKFRITAETMAGITEEQRLRIDPRDHALDIEVVP